MAETSTTATESVEEVEDLYPYLGGLKLSAQVMGLSVHYPSKTVAIAVSRLDGDVWDGCVELWEMSSLDETSSTQSPKTCAGRRPIPCGVSDVRWCSGSDGQPLVVVGRDDGDVDIFEWDSRNRKVNPVLTLTEHDDMINSITTPILDLNSPNYDSIVATGSSDGTVRVWNVTGPTAQSSVRTLPSPFYGMSVQATTPAPWANGLDVLLVAYGGSSAQKGPGLGLWDCSKGLLEPSSFKFEHTDTESESIFIDRCATPISLSYSKDPLHLHEFVVGFDDGTIAVYSDVDLKPIRVQKPHGNFAIRCLDTVMVTEENMSDSSDTTKCVIYSASESCTAMITEWDLSRGDVIDTRNDYVLSITGSLTSDLKEKRAVLTGGVDGQVRLLDVTKYM